MQYPFGYCGMPCALCKRYRTKGSSRCLGCSDGGYYTEGCKVCRCCREKALPHCGACETVPCKRLGAMNDFRDLNTGHVKRRTCASVAHEGFDAWYAHYIKKAALLDRALDAYNDGRSKRYLCELFIQRGLGELEEIMSRAASISGEPKAAAKAFRAVVAAMDAENAVTLRPFAPGDLPLFALWLAAPHVAPWYKDPAAWLEEAENRDGRYDFLRRFIAERGGVPIGFAQYYVYRDGGEDWYGGDTAGLYSIDYLLGDAALVGRGLGRRLVLALLEQLGALADAKRVAVKPEAENLPSCGALLSCGFRFDKEYDCYTCDFKTKGEEK